MNVQNYNTVISVFLLCWSCFISGKIEEEGGNRTERGEHLLISSNVSCRTALYTYYSWGLEGQATVRVQWGARKLRGMTEAEMKT